MAQIAWPLLGPFNPAFGQFLVARRPGQLRDRHVSQVMHVDG